MALKRHPPISHTSVLLDQRPLEHKLFSLFAGGRSVVQQADFGGAVPSHGSHGGVSCLANSSAWSVFALALWQVAISALKIADLQSSHTSPIQILLSEHIAVEVRVKPNSSADPTTVQIAVYG